MSLQAACASQLSRPETRGMAMGLVLAAGSLTYDHSFQKIAEELLTLLQRTLRMPSRRTTDCSRMARTVDVRWCDSHGGGASRILVPIATEQQVARCRIGRRKASMLKAGRDLSNPAVWIMCR